jgi:MFS family permease
MRFVRHTPAIRSAMMRTIAYSLPAAAPWAMLPLFVRQELGLGAGMYGLILGMMGIGGVTSGMLLPAIRARFSRNATVLLCSALSCLGTALLAVSHHWLPAAAGMLLFGLGWTAAYATMQAAAQLACPAWVRARSLSIYQLAQNGALTLGSFAWGWLAGMVGMTTALLAAAGVGAVLAFGARYFQIEAVAPSVATASESAPLTPEAPAAAFVPFLRNARGRVMEIAHYRVQPDQRAAFLTFMREVHPIRGRCGAKFWQLYEDVAHPDGWIEIWSMESWVDHLREVARLSDEDRAVLARASTFQRDAARPTRYLAVDPSADLGEGTIGQPMPVPKQTPGTTVARHYL